MFELRVLLLIMPIYEYKCNDCGHEYELMQKMGDAPVVECENCHKSTAVRLISASGFQLKGTGWYETDFKNKGKPPTAVKDSKVAESAASKQVDGAKDTSKDGG